MNPPPVRVDQSAAREFQDVVEDVFHRFSGSRQSVAVMERSSSAYQTSSSLEDLHVTFQDGHSVHLLMKDVSRQGLVGDARHVKPAWLHDPLREIEVYQRFLAPSHIGTPTFYGAVVDPTIGRYWLFLEYVPGWRLFEVSEPLWLDAARWIARLHVQYAGRLGQIQLNHASHLIRYDEPFYSVWAKRALSIVTDTPSRYPGTQRQALERVVRRYDQVVAHLLALPTTLIHGEYVASNVLIQTSRHPYRLCPIDWEMAANGPGLIDLAELTAGHWTLEQRRALTDAYLDELDRTPTPLSVRRGFDIDFACCRLHLAMQWLGWSSNWSPSSYHVYPWLDEALDIAGQLGL